MTASKLKVSFLGPHASYSHQAVRQAFLEPTWDLTPVQTISDVFESVSSGSTSYGLVPFENSTNGSVVLTLDDLADRSGRFASLSICGEVYVDVHHCLLGHRAPSSHLDDGGSGTCTPTADVPRPVQPRVRPTGSLKHVTRLYSHPQAFGQCNAFISAYLKGVEVFEVSSTSRAAEIVKGDTTGTWAAIASELAGEMHGLDMLGRGIEDRSDNTTRFLIIRRTPQDPSQGEIGGGRDMGTKSMVSFSVPHGEPGALAEVLSCFKARSLNLTSINSRPSLLQPFQYIFFVEFEGHRYQDPEGRVRETLERIEAVAERTRWLGSWQRHR